MSTLINKQTVRRFILEYAHRTRHHQFTRVAPDVCAQLEQRIREACRTIVKIQPSKGLNIR